ncbi:MAG: acyl-CoA dehydrogenase [Gemmobacter sp.]|nr:acyl-CoA dehydrogenase [Gemmobacter sp.]
MAADLIADSAARLFAQHADAPQDGSWPAALWRAIEDAGFPLALLAEQDGGFGLGPEDSMTPLRISASVAAAVPLAETMLANWILARAGLPLAQGPAAVVFGPVRQVPWGRNLSVLVICGDAMGSSLVSACPVGPADWQHGVSLAGEPRDDLIPALPVDAQAHLPLDPRVPQALAAMLRCQQIAGALEAVLALSVRYASDRVQFGRPIGKLQAIQQYLAVMATETAAAGVAAQMAAQTLPLADDQPDRLILLTAAAKIRAGEAAGKVAELAHQVHGAIGFSQEYPLHPLTRRLWTWRDDHGRESDWAATLGQSLARGYGQGLWSQITTLQSDRF